MRGRNSGLATLVVALVFTNVALAADWPRFRGPNGTGISDDSVPTEWSDTKNLKWKRELPGPGLSSPIVVGERVFVTCWSGYGTSLGDQGDIENLRRHLICIDRSSGEILWQKSVEPVLPEEPYRGMFAQHGYASHTPVSDGEHVFAFFGKTGVFAFDMDGNQLWQHGVGTEDDDRHWGSASSPILYKNLVIVPATTESQALVALNKATGDEVWRKEARGFGSTWGTPLIVDLADGRQEIVFAVPYEIWAFDPETGKLNWYSESVDSDSMCSSAIEHDGIVYAIEGRSGGSVAIRTGGSGNVTESHVVWSGRERGRISSPLYYEGRIYWVTGGIANCLDAATGERIYQARLQRSSARGEQANRGESGGRGFGGGRGGAGGQDYSSPIIAGDKMYYFSRSGEATVIKLGTEYEQLASNRFESDTSDFSATPAISDGQMFIRSNAYLYCIAAE